MGGGGGGGGGGQAAGRVLLRRGRDEVAAEAPPDLGVGAGDGVVLAVSSAIVSRDISWIITPTLSSCYVVHLYEIKCGKVFVPHSRESSADFLDKDSHKVQQLPSCCFVQLSPSTLARAILLRS